MKRVLVVLFVSIIYNIVTTNEVVAISNLYGLNEIPPYEPINKKEISPRAHSGRVEDGIKIGSHRFSSDESPSPIGSHRSRKS